MASVDENLFAGPSEVSSATLKKLVIADHEEDVSAALRRFKWNGKTAGAIVLDLSEDNRRVVSGTFCVRGTLGKETRLQADKLWPEGDSQMALNIRIPAGEQFTFSDGSLASDYLQSDRVAHKFQVREDGGSWRNLAEEEIEDWGGGQFCLRLVASLHKASARGGVTLKYWVLLFPGEPEAVLNVSELAQHASWPGIAVCEGEMSLLPACGKAWMAPIFPLLMAATPLHVADNFPTGEELRRCVDSIMARSAAAEVLADRQAVTDRWQVLANQPDSFEARPSGVIWPAPAEPGETTGVFCSL